MFHLVRFLRRFHLLVRSSFPFLPPPPPPLLPLFLSLLAFIPPCLSQRFIFYICLPFFRSRTIFPSYHHHSFHRTKVVDVLGPWLRFSAPVPGLFPSKVLKSFTWLFFSFDFSPSTPPPHVPLLLMTAVAVAAAEVTEILPACICFHLRL